MVTTTITIKAIPVKQQELLQTLHELQPLIQEEQGCYQCSIRQKNPQTSQISICEEWATRENVLSFVRSKYFYVLCGAIKVLAYAARITLRTDVHAVSMDVKLSRPVQGMQAWIEDALSKMPQSPEPPPQLSQQTHSKEMI